MISQALERNNKLLNNLDKQIIQAIEKNNLQAAADMTLKLAKDSRFSETWMCEQASALKTGDFTQLTDLFQKGEFYGPNGDFLIAAPYTRVEGDKELTNMSGICGKRILIKHQALENLDNLILEATGYLHQRTLRVDSFYKIYGCGHFLGQNSLPFIPPNGWAFSRGDGPVLNNVNAQNGRFISDIKNFAPRILAKETANLILNLIEDQTNFMQLQQLEYQFHEAGHASGLGLTYKLQNQLLPGYWLGAVEDWRADGVELELMARRVTRQELSEEEAGKVAAVYLGIKLGADAFRLGGPDKDYDVNASILTLDRLLESGAFRIDRKGLLTLRQPSYQSLFRAFQTHRNEAMCLTQRELTLDSPTGILHLYGSVRLPQTTRLFFQSFLERCNI